MDIRKIIISILNEVKPTVNLENVPDIIDGGYIDSFELLALISKLDENFDIEISVDDMTTSNFNTVDAIESLIKKMVNK